GGRVYAQWRGLEGPGLFENRDLAIATDVRSVLAEALGATLRPPDMARVFPGFAPARLGLID
ncbi:MAG TPA: transcriptional initiation protein Tat, partial [Myxococcaceae bacterium]|nr:transcriptional initiation protein Tat [Myxococcaceae bacterium]